MAGSSTAIASNEPSRASLIVTKAKEVAHDAAGTAYTSGGKTLTGFDCSGFVYYVFHAVIPSYDYLTADGIASSTLFTQVTSPGEGDIIYFPSGQNPYEVHRGNTRTYPAHVGIVVNELTWIGRQTSQLGIVMRNNPWWAGRGGIAYYRYSGLQTGAANINFLQSQSARNNA